MAMMLIGHQPVEEHVGRCCEHSEGNPHILYLVDIIPAHYTYWIYTYPSTPRLRTRYKKKHCYFIVSKKKNDENQNDRTGTCSVSRALSQVQRRRQAKGNTAWWVDFSGRASRKGSHYLPGGVDPGWLSPPKILERIIVMVDPNRRVTTCAQRQVLRRS